MIDSSLVEKLKEKISDFSEYKIFTHKNPDGDAIGSVLALKKILQLRNKSVEAFVFNSLGRHLYFLPGSEKVRVQKEFKSAAGDPALFILIDCASWSRTGFPFFDLAEKEVVAIDHHPEKPIFDPAERPEEPLIFKIIDPVASSTAEIIFTLGKELNWKIDPEISFCLLTGILSDTGAFRHSNTTPEALKAVATLLKSGVNIKKIADNLFKKNGFPSQLKIWGEVLSRVSYDPLTKMAFSFALLEDLKKYDVKEDELSGLVNMLSAVPESRFSLLLVENSLGKIKASLRSEPHKKTDVAKIARIFGGGGHKLAAGFEIEGVLEEKLAAIKKKIAEGIDIQ